MAVETTNTNVQYFSSTGTETHIFSRPISNLIVTFTSTNNMSLDGTNFMTMTAGTYQFNNLGLIKTVAFTGAGSRVGFGIAL